MKTTAILAGLAALAVLGGCQFMSNSVKIDPAAYSVGKNPGDIGKSSDNNSDLDKSAAKRNHALASFAEGCFWHTEEQYRGVPGVVATAVGYTGGSTKNPTYEEVCSHTTRHAEAVLIEFDPKKITYKKLLEKFFESHDPTTIDRQGFDVGDSYRSAIFTHSPEQKTEAEEFIAELTKSKKFSDKIVTQVIPAMPFYLAEDYHQQYIEKGNPDVCKLK